MRDEEKMSIAAGLGASRVVDVRQRQVRGPLDLLALRRELHERLRSSGGRPSDPNWTVTRLIPFRPESWGQLQELAGEIGDSGRRVAAAHVAALLIENGLEEIEEMQWHETLRRSRQLELLTQPAAADSVGLTYNDFDDWVQAGWIVPASRRGRQRYFSVDEVVRALWLRNLIRLGGDAPSVSARIRTSDLSARYLVSSGWEAITTAATRSQLLRMLADRGGHLVLDQLPMRREFLGLPPMPEIGHEEQHPSKAV